MPFRLIVVGFLLVNGACGSDDPTQVPASDVATLYWAFELNHHAITLSKISPWDTVQLSGVAKTYKGDTIRFDSKTIQFESLDSNAVSVTPTGLIRGKTVTGGISVIARLTIGRVTYSDTAIVKVVENSAPKQLQSISIQPTPPDSAKISTTTFPFTVQRFLKRTAVDNTQMSEILMYYRSENPLALGVDRKTGTVANPLINRRLGKVKIIASAYAYGISRADTLDLTIGYPLLSKMFFRLRAKADGTGVEVYADMGNPVTIGVGGVVSFNAGALSDTVYVIFDDTTHIEISSRRGDAGESISTSLIGNVVTREDPIYLGIISRRFTAPGEYVFRDTKHHIVGRIHVIDEHATSSSQSSLTNDGGSQ